MNTQIKTTALTRQSELRTAREALGWTQQRLSEACGLPATLISSVECGAAERMACALRGPLRERVASSLDGDDPDEGALSALRGLRRVCV